MKITEKTKVMTTTIIELSDEEVDFMTAICRHYYVTAMKSRQEPATFARILSDRLEEQMI